MRWGAARGGAAHQWFRFASRIAAFPAAAGAPAPAARCDAPEPETGSGPEAADAPDTEPGRGPEKEPERALLPVAAEGPSNQKRR